MAERGGFGLDTIFEIRPVSSNTARSGTLTTRAIRTSLATNPQMGLSTNPWDAADFGDQIRKAESGWTTGMEWSPGNGLPTDRRRKERS